MVNAQIVALIALSISVVSSSATLDTALAAHDTTVVVFQGKATIVYVDNGLRHGSINVNDTVAVGWYQQSDATDFNEDPKFGSYQNVELESFKLSSVLGASRTCSVEVFNASPNAREGDMIFLSCNSFTAQSSPINGYGLDMFTVRLDDTTGSAISDDSLPLTLNLTEWTSAQASLWYSKGPEVPLLILGSFTSLTSSYNESDFTSSPAPPPSDSTPLPPPSEVNVVSTSVNNAELSWTAIEGAVGYNIFRSTSIDGPFELINDSAVNSTRYFDNRLSAATYYYKVATVDKEGVESDHSKMVSVSIEEIVTKEPIPPSITPPSEPVPSPELTTPIESPVPFSPSGDIAAPPIPPPMDSATTNVALWGTIGVVPAAATVVAVLWKKGAFRGRTRLETATAIERQTVAPVTEIDLMGKNIDKMSSSVPSESCLFTASAFAAGKVMEPEIKRESTALETAPEQTEVKMVPMLELKSEPEPTEVKMVPMLELKSEPEQTEVKMVPMLELKSEPDTQLKDYFEAIDKVQEAEAVEKYLDEDTKYVDGGTKQKKKAGKQKQRARKKKKAGKQKQRARKKKKAGKQSKKARKQKARKR